MFSSSCAVENAAAAMSDDSYDPSEIPAKSRTFRTTRSEIVSSADAGTFGQIPTSLPPSRLAPFQTGVAETAITPMTVKRYRKPPKQTIDISTQTDNPSAIELNYYKAPMETNEPIPVYKGASVSVTQQILQLRDVDAGLRERSTAMDCLVIALDRGIDDTTENAIEEAPLLESIAANKKDDVENRREEDKMAKPKGNDKDGCLSCIAMTMDCCSII